MGIRNILPVALSVLLLTGCGQPSAPPEEPKYEGYVDEAVLTVPEEPEESTEPVETPEEPVTEETPAPEPEAPSPAEPPQQQVDAGLEAEQEALSSSPAALPKTVEAQASGTAVQQTDRAVIDYSHTDDGYVMVQFTGQTEQRLKAQVKGPTTTYTYNLTPGQWAVFPLSDGNGGYQVTVYENVKDTSYAAVMAATFDVALKNEFAPYLLPNQYVNYAAGSTVVVKAAELTGSEPDALKKVELVYDYVVDTLTYDVEKAASVQSGYLPNLDRVLETKRGICFDYAALMTGMLRSQGVPCKLVVGYAGSAYHAWISVWSPESGWVDGVIFFDGASWQRMDPTFASSGNKSESIMQYIGDGTNYTAKYFY